MFTEQQITQRKTIGEKLRAARMAAEVSIEAVARQIRISAKYLDALERGKYNDLPSPVYIKNYTQIYAEHLGLSWEDLEEQYKQEITVYQHSPKTQEEENSSVLRTRSRRKLFASVTQHHRSPLMVSRLLRFGLVGIIALILLSYFAYSVVRLLSPPDLELTYPTEDIIVTERIIQVSGQSTPEAVVTINGQPVAVEQDGSFTEEVVLRAGLNTLHITTQSKYGRERSITRYIQQDASSEQQK